jgi:hypothetical protein
VRVWHVAKDKEVPALSQTARQEWGNLQERLITATDQHLFSVVRHLATKSSIRIRDAKFFSVPACVLGCYAYLENVVPAWNAVLYTRHGVTNKYSCVIRPVENQINVLVSGGVKVKFGLFHKCIIVHLL